MFVEFKAGKEESLKAWLGDVDVGGTAGWEDLD